MEHNVQFIRNKYLLIDCVSNLFYNSVEDPQDLKTFNKPFLDLFCKRWKKKHLKLNEKHLSAQIVSHVFIGIKEQQKMKLACHFPKNIRKYFIE